MYFPHAQYSDIMNELREIEGFEHLVEDENISFEAGKSKKRKQMTNMQPKQQSKTASTAKNIRWDHGLDGNLVYYAHKFEAWKKTSINMDEKWQLVCQTMWAAKLFSADLSRDDIKATNLRKQFERLWNKISAR